MTEQASPTALPDVRAPLLDTRRDAPGVRGFLTTVDHKRIAARYVLTAMAMLVLAGLLAVDMRLQLSRPDMERMGPQGFNEAFALHGSTMLFLVSVPVMEVPASRALAIPKSITFTPWLVISTLLGLRSRWTTPAA